jgi:hypothetical protein
VGGYPGNDDAGRELRAKLGQAKLARDCTLAFLGKRLR